MQWHGDQMLSHVTLFRGQQFVPFIKESVLTYDLIPWNKITNEIHLKKIQWNGIELSGGSKNEFLNWRKAELGYHNDNGIDEGEEKEEEQVKS